MAPTAPQTVTSSFLLGNLHCPTCVSSIKAAIYCAFLGGDSSSQDNSSSSSSIIKWVSPNVVTSVVTVEHAPGASLRRMRQALEDRGFEVCAVATTAEELSDLDPDLYLVKDGAGISEGRLLQTGQPSTSDSQNNNNNMNRSTPSLTRWFKPLRSSAPRGQRHQTHLEHCEQCRTSGAMPASTEPSDVEEKHPLETFKSATGTAETTPTTPTKPTAALFPTPAAPPSSTHTKPLPPLPSQDHQGQQQAFIAIDSGGVVRPLYRATLAVGGMTCASCAASIREGLQQHDWIASVVAVDVIGGSATVDLRDSEKAEALVEAIEELGFEATLVDVNEVPTPGTAKIGSEAGRELPVSESDTWRASLAIVGMTCASCSNSITRELKTKAWVREVAVNLLTHSATVDFDGRENANKLVEAIEDLGFEATLTGVTPLTPSKQAEATTSPTTATDGQTPSRTVDILITGLYCAHCPQRILASLSAFPSHHHLRILTPPTLQRPILKLSYVPSAPSFTIRHILAAISASDPHFTPSIHHPPTLEERAKQIQRQHRRAVLWRVVFSGLVGIPTLIIGIVYMSLVPRHSASAHFLMEPWTSGISRAQIALFIMATPVYFFAADLFHRRAIKEIRALWRRGSRVPVIQRFYRFGSMNTLMSLGTTIAYISSVSQMIAAAVDRPTEVNDSNFYFDSVVFLTFFLMLGRLIESYSKAKTGDAVEQLAKLRPTTAVLIEGYGTPTERDAVVQADLLDYGDVVRIPHGGSPPADATIVKGESTFDESSLTGESRPVRKQPGDPVFAGTVNSGAQAVLARITGAAGSSMLDKIVEVVREGQTKRAPIEQVADVMTSYFVPVVTLIAVLTWIVWLSLGLSGRIPGHFLDVTSGGWVAFSLQFAIAVFVVACPCGLALAAPTAIFVGSGLAAKHGILAKGGGEAFEKASRVDVVVFDKTGTLTQGGEPSVTDSEVYVEEDRQEVVIAALKAVEENSSHPIAKAIVGFCAGKTTARVSVDDLQEFPGKGLKATARSSAVTPSEKEVEDTSPTTTFDLAVGNEAFMSDLAVSIPPQTATTLDRWKSEAKSIALVATRHHSSDSEKATTTPWTLSLALSISDPIRPEAPLIIRALQSSGTRVWMLSGDNPTTAAAVARQLGIPSDQVIAGVLPTGKADKIKYLQSTLRAQKKRRLLRGWSRRGADELATKRAMVAMVGDGINDSPALTSADVGIAIGSGADVAISSADFVLVKSDLRAVVDLLDMSKVVLRRIMFNFGWAVVYNCLALPVAAGVFYPVVTPSGQHIRLDPVWASLAMALSSISVVLSSLALRVRWGAIGFRERRIE
ncbi:hypothetical protein VTJ49DRAFT_6747 [Mycothermus thermophilus]|uniref:HMA domain-containing protein n=1 Tax=Humicola insolens TaxID=85995 RepID=A0ABR3VIR6_HUMIN